MVAKFPATARCVRCGSKKGKGEAGETRRARDGKSKKGRGAGDEAPRVNGLEPTHQKSRAEETEPVQISPYGDQSVSSRKSQLRRIR